MWPLNEKLKGAVSVPIALSVVLIPFSLLIGWNLATMILFWLLIVPIIAIYLPIRVSKNKSHLFESLIGLIIFYAIMVWMIYDHFKTDYFKIMILSCLVNMFLICLITWASRKIHAQ